MLAPAAAIRASILAANPKLLGQRFEQNARTVMEDLSLLARCAASKCLITYSMATKLRGHGIARNGKWLDDVYEHAVLPLGFPDLTMLVVNQATGAPSSSVFKDGRSSLSRIPISDVKTEQLRCIWYSGYEAVLGPLEPIQRAWMHSFLDTDEPPREREIARAVRNAAGRVASSGVEKAITGRDYPDSLPLAALLTIVADLWTQQGGRCALTGQAFELRSNNEGGVQDDRCSLDRIDNSRGYAIGNVQLVTQFANRARGTLSCEDARRRLVQF